MNKDRKALNKLIADTQKVLDKAKKDLEALDRPTLRHGDYGYIGGKVASKILMRVFIKTTNGDIRHFQGTPCSCDPCVCADCEDYTILGNIFDEMAVNV